MELYRYKTENFCHCCGKPVEKGHGNICSDCISNGGCAGHPGRKCSKHDKAVYVSGFGEEQCDCSHCVGRELDGIQICNLPGKEYERSGFKSKICPFTSVGGRKLCTFYYKARRLFRWVLDEQQESEKELCLYYNETGECGFYHQYCFANTLGEDFVKNFCDKVVSKVVRVRTEDGKVLWPLPKPKRMLRLPDDNR